MFYRFESLHAHTKSLVTNCVTRLFLFSIKPRPETFGNSGTGRRCFAVGPRPNFGGGVARYIYNDYLCNMDANIRILVVDDEETLCDTLGFNLEAEGYTADTAYSAEQALSLDLSGYNLFLLDIMMGDISGIQLARILKSNPATASIPIIFCTAKDSEEDMIKGLDLGADDYIAKPYSLKAVLARIRAVLRRSIPGPAADAHDRDSTIAYKGLVLYDDKKSCIVDGSEVKMPRKEYEILRKLLSNPGHIFSRTELLDEIWPDEVVVLDRVVDVNITRIRQKIGTYSRHIVTRSGYGYGFME